MRTLLFAAALTAAFPAEPDARILRLITPETYKVAGIDSERYRVPAMDIDRAIRLKREFAADREKHSFTEEQ